ncbi:hypothetical protein CD30_11940 [Ureibacillus massiliensis 4400831 = CIP 108448 = CCUG 49529]|uniref:DUF309 domain-containing protein n=1 Tax=Ureibacillus massiliensis 4400831 = CIP 108448 = CCUG 49529 TaxID=1211035 RepID=A0A0A3J3W6_9BACL|nr:DUF309 domain-containing protein [Ureibacillus massiliensis]KGR90390.1 hypothetical protein CD30_11940 [Ureibacillus massiliensis 4400831 = CIP 108448 = CCUG 49529]
MHSLFHPLFVQYFTYFNGNKDYFECHEVLEEYWKILAPGDKKHSLVGYIQLATGMYHWRRNNQKGALKIFKKAYRNLELNKSSIFVQCIDSEDLQLKCRNCISQMEQGLPFTSFQIVLLNNDLQKLVDKQIENLPTYSYDFLLNKHMLRDRSDILKERDLKKARKKDF